MKIDHRLHTTDYRFQTKDNKFRSYVLCLASYVLCFCTSLVTRGSSLEVSSPESREPNAVSSTELINNAKNYDGKIIVYAGEAIGDVMMRGDFAWINVNDGQNAMGIWLNRESAVKIKITGSYNHIGDQIMVTGVFHRNCLEHGGDMDIHAQDMQIISTGKTLSETLDTAKRNVFFILLAIICLAVIFLRHPKNVSS